MAAAVATTHGRIDKLRRQSATGSATATMTGAARAIRFVAVT
jgi:hypothetical protein